MNHMFDLPDNLSVPVEYGLDLKSQDDANKWYSDLNLYMMNQTNNIVQSNLHNNNSVPGDACNKIRK